MDDKLKFFIKREIKHLQEKLIDLSSDLSYLRALTDSEGLKDIALDLDGVAEGIDKAEYELGNVRDDLEDSDELDESKKKKRDYTITPNAGNAEYNTNMFNHMNGSDTDANFFPGVAEGASPNKTKAKRRYSYVGPVIRFGKEWDYINAPIYVVAISDKQALNFLCSRLKGEYGLANNADLSLDSDGLRYADEADRNTVLNDPKFNYDDEDRPDEYEVGD